MTRRESVRRLAVVATCIAVSTSGCAFGGLNSLPLPGTVGHGEGSKTYHVELANVGQLESNSPVMVGDVVVGSVGDMTVNDWHADVKVSVEPGVVIPANAVATVGQTSLLGSMHLALNPPLGQAPTGVLQPGATLGLNRSSTYPSTEQTLSALSVVVNGGGLGQIGDIVRDFSAALGGRENNIRDLLTRLNDFVGLLADQRDSINAAVTSLNNLAGTFAGQKEVLTNALNRIPPALDVLVNERPRIVTALTKFRDFSNLATGLVNDSGADLVRNLQNLEPTLKSLADVGPKLDTALAYLPTFPYTQSIIDRAIRGDYMNQFIVFDFTVPRLKRSLFVGTRWGDENAKLVPAPGDPWYATYTYDPLHAPITPTPAQIGDLPPLVDPVPSAAATSQSAQRADPSAAHGSGTGPPPGPAPDPSPQGGGGN
ncbi:MCE family protein [Mycolicibacterium sp. P1-5]|uniref:MCE family protein n=1 Tax=Mycolicibacterium sp. P1-5 TaxID=2024617 RepID=UPI0011EF4B83|nr:MCE family protein [Mycolicibacterium sp. P1-5]KAA0102766.1 MCE family protein [Mycolicibacterium sp. P1-5]